MKTTTRFILFSVILPFAATTSQVFAQNYNWASWTFPTGQTASASLGTLGTVNLAVSGPSTSAVPYSIGFNGVPFTPTVAPAVGAVNPTYDQNWSFTIDLSGVTDTSKLVVGVGNFGFGNADYPGYQLDAFDTSMAPMSLGGINQIGAYDHTWLSNGNVMFNDSVSLNQVTGVFNCSVVPGLNDGNSDILLMGLPAGVGALTINTVAPSGGDTINVVVATVPEPGCVGLLALGGSMLLGCRHRRKSR